MAIHLEGVGEEDFDAGSFKGTMAYGLYNQVNDMLGNNLNSAIDKDKTLQTQLRRTLGG